MNDLTEKAMLVHQTIKLWSGRKFDRRITRQVLDQHQADEDAGRWNKHLIAKRAFDALNCAKSEARKHHYAHTLAWEDAGARILPAAAYYEYMEEQRAFAEGFDTAVSAFVDGYPEYVAAAKDSLNGMFNPDDYPATGEIASRFAFDTHVSPLPRAGDFRVTLNREEITRIQADIEERGRTMLQHATQECWSRLYDAVQHMSERLAEPDNRFRDTLVTNLRELIELLPKLNIADDPGLERMRQAAAEKLCDNDPGVLRPTSSEFDPAARTRQAHDADDLLRRMDGYAS